LPGFAVISLITNKSEAETQGQYGAVLYWQGKRSHSFSSHMNKINGFKNESSDFMMLVCACAHARYSRRACAT
jgi:hypothetical protein